MPESMRPLLRDQPHRRWNALTGDWVFVSPHRSLRPWQGQAEVPERAEPSRYDPSCYLCPGNVRAGGAHNPAYASTYVFTNDYPAFLPETGNEVAMPTDPLLRAEPHRGTCRVICYSPRHDLALAQLSQEQIGSVIEAWASESTALGRSWQWVQIFENRGAMMGCSNPHPHGQIWAGDFLPREPTKELVSQREWFRVHAAPLLLDYAWREQSAQERIVLSNDDWMAVVPWWASWPYETLVLPCRRQLTQLSELTAPERANLALLFKQLLTLYDHLFDAPFPYSMGWHGAPCGPRSEHGDIECWQLHAHFYPPLLRSASIRKFMVGYEMMAEPQRDLTPEQAAERLRALHSQGALSHLARSRTTSSS
jgi:UDPglucose--hexose-1-phosphate uridylyltransferase